MSSKIKGEKAEGGARKRRSLNSPHLKTSIGKSPNSRPKNKHKKKNFKKYNRQGK